MPPSHHLTPFLIAIDVSAYDEPDRARRAVYFVDAGKSWSAPTLMNKRNRKRATSAKFRKIMNEKLIKISDSSAERDGKSFY